MKICGDGRWVWETEGEKKNRRGECSLRVWSPTALSLLALVKPLCLRTHAVDHSVFGRPPVGTADLGLSRRLALRRWLWRLVLPTHLAITCLGLGVFILGHGSTMIWGSRV